LAAFGRSSSERVNEDQLLVYDIDDKIVKENEPAHAQVIVPSIKKNALRRQQIKTK
jgi:hypothetical protein